MNPKFEPGHNIAMKVPVHEYDDPVAFYRDVLGLTPILEQAPSRMESVGFDFGRKVLWIGSFVESGRDLTRSCYK